MDKVMMIIEISIVGFVLLILMGYLFFLFVFILEVLIARALGDDEDVWYDSRNNSRNNILDSGCRGFILCMWKGVIIKTINIKGKNYVPVVERLKEFRSSENFKNWSLETEWLSIT